jgi:predicted metal-dependent HD superfamily phosphohydrolase
MGGGKTLMYNTTIEKRLYDALVVARRVNFPAPEKVHSVVSDVVSRYRDPWRHYHTILHPLDCLTGLDLFKDNIGGSYSSAELALWYHDVVHDPKLHDNEEQSVTLLQEHAEKLDLDPSTISTACEAILATRHKEPPTSDTAKTVVDLDLNILRTSTDRFDLYERRVREEYPWVPDEAWILGRTRVLKAFLDREWIYSTALFRKRFEGDARANLRRSLERLGRGEVLRMV